MINTENIGLVLEGGGMRGVFTCGVLDYFMDQNITFPYTIGVSPERVMDSRICQDNEGELNSVISIFWPNTNILG